MLGGVLVALLPMLWLWGFTVDDALISARVAVNIASGTGYRFNYGGPVVDAVTPLGWAYLLAPFAHEGVIATWQAARLISAGAWLLAAGWLGVQMLGVASRWRAAPLLALGTCAPVAAWAASGMETGCVLLLTTLALARRWWAPWVAGLAAAWRPELVPWAVVLALGSTVVQKRTPLHLLGALVAALGPPALMAAIRQGVFGSATPLSAMAKPSDLAHGWRYMISAVLLSGPPILLLAPRAVWRISGHAVAIVTAFMVHLLALVMVGGDWMALFRLLVPVLPGLLLVAAEIAAHSSFWPNLGRHLLAVGVGALLSYDPGTRARGVWKDRLALMNAARPWVSASQNVASVDIGWLGAVCPGRVTDLAGVTDPSVAAMPGGHTSKRIPRQFLAARKVQLLLLLTQRDTQKTPWWERQFRGRVEARLASYAKEQGYELRGSLPLGKTQKEYLVLEAPDRRP